MSEADIQLINKVTTWLKEQSGEHPSHEQIELELARRANEAVEMYQDVARQLADLRNTRP